MMTMTLTPELLQNVDAYWRAANYRSFGQIYLLDDPLLKKPLKLVTCKSIERHARLSGMS
jgi:xylulose-5-phosphate/fructose-6-phosphate phosphoketolase